MDVDEARLHSVAALVVIFGKKEKVVEEVQYLYTAGKSELFK